MVLLKTDYNSKITEIEGKIPSISGLATNAALTAVENKIPNISSLVKKTDYNTKITEIEKKLTDHNHDKYITTPEFNTLAADAFNARLAQANLIAKTDFDAKLSSLNRKITANKTKRLLVENELKKLKIFDSIYFRGKSHFEEDGTQSYLVFQPIQRYFKRIVNVGNDNYVYYWKSKGLSDEKINSIKTSDYGITPYLSYYDTNKIRVKFITIYHNIIVFLSQYYFKVLKTIILNAAHYFIIKIPNKRQLQQIASNHLSDIQFRYSMKLYKNYAKVSHFHF